ncbi:hypothetical protein AVEN_178516-1 [Araneus ventricosus]|uniref:Uncharacterized protein n=1 Tax=Araneus ventricosus TaxID=182803 RepID=A0A4Y2CEA3_ARAVE|nr:hypothetical protein AVEN_178516-1 [Araneus ventricosus]
MVSFNLRKIIISRSKFWTITYLFIGYFAGRGGLAARSWRRNRRVLDSKPDSAEGSPYLWAQCTPNPISANHPPSCVVRSSEREVPPEVPPTSPSHGSKLRDPFENSPCVASIWDVDVTKLN